MMTKLTFSSPKEVDLDKIFDILQGAGIQGLFTDFEIHYENETEVEATNGEGIIDPLDEVGEEFDDEDGEHTVEEGREVHAQYGQWNVARDGHIPGSRQQRLWQLVVEKLNKPFTVRAVARLCPEVGLKRDTASPTVSLWAKKFKWIKKIGRANGRRYVYERVREE